MPRGKPFWSAYRQYFVRELLAKKVSRAVIAERLGVTRGALNHAIHNHALNRPKPEATHHVSS